MTHSRRELSGWTQALRAAGSVAWFLSTLIGATAPAGASVYQATRPLAVSGTSPFAACTADELAYNPIVLDQEAEPYLVVDPRDPDHIVGTWIQDQRVNDGNGRGFGIGTSFDGGVTWETTVVSGMGVCTGGTFYYHADPWLAFGPDGSLFQIGLPWSWPGPPGPVPEGFADVIALVASNDGGRTWNAPLEIAASAYPNYGDDKPSVTVDPLDPRYVYATWTYYAGAVDDSNVTKFARSTDGGVTWEAPRTVFEPGSAKTTWGHQIHVLPNGTLVSIADMNQAGSRLVVQRSADRGGTWEPTDSRAFVLPIVLRPAFAPDDGMRVNGGNVNSAVDRDTGALYAVWQDLRPDGSAHASFSLSNDAGSTWSAPIVVAQTPTGHGVRSQSFLPMVAVAGDGTVGVLYYDWRNDDAGADTRTDVWLIHCHARLANCSDAASWHGEARVTERSFDLTQTPLQHFLGNPALSYFLGDYVGLAATEHDFLAFFTQPHDGDPGSIFFARIAPIGCIGDCNADDGVTINELITMVNIALGTANVTACTAGDANGDGAITISEIIIAVNRALTGCTDAAQACGGIAGPPCGTGEVCDRRDPTCSVGDLAGTCVPGPFPCPSGGEPVCGCDAVTYANDCTRLSAGAPLEHAGACAGGP